MKKIILLVVILFVTNTFAKTEKLFYPDGTVKSAISYKNGKKNGIEHDYYPDGATLMYEKPYRNDKLHGIVQSYTNKAIIKYEMTYRYGLLDGKSRFYDDKAQLKAEITYKKGLKDGAMNIYYPSGIMKIGTTWKHNKLINGYKYDKNGSRKAFNAQEMKIFSEANR